MEALVSLLGLKPTDSRLTSYLATTITDADPEPEVKVYPGIEYRNYRKLGLSLQCKYCPRAKTQAVR